MQVLLDTGRAVGAKELKDYLEVTGYTDAAKWVYTQAHARGARRVCDSVAFGSAPSVP